MLGLKLVKGPHICNYEERHRSYLRFTYKKNQEMLLSFDQKYIDIYVRKYISYTYTHPVIHRVYISAQ